MLSVSNIITPAQVRIADIHLMKTFLCPIADGIAADPRN